MAAHGTGDLSAVQGLLEQGYTGNVDVTHSLVAQPGGIVLKRNHFACGFCQGVGGPGRRCH